MDLCVDGWTDGSKCRRMDGWADENESCDNTKRSGDEKDERRSTSEKTQGSRGQIEKLNRINSEWEKQLSSRKVKDKMFVSR